MQRHLSRRKSLQLAASCAAVLAIPSIGRATDGFTVTDVLNRTVALRGPAKRAFLGMYLEDILAVVGPTLLDRTVAMSIGTWRDWKNKQWQAYTAKLPALEKLLDSGEVSDKSFSVEKVIAANPDVIILAAWQWDTLGPQVERFTNARIPVVVIDLNAQTLEKHLSSARLIGRLFGSEVRAEAIVTEYSQALADVDTRLQRSRAPRRKVYLELGMKGAAEIGNTYDKAMWGPMIARAGGDNIAAGKVGNWGPMTAEGILAAQPEVIFLSGGEWINNKVALKMGFGMSSADARDIVRGFVARPGWVDLPAVKQGQVHCVAQGMIRSLHDFTQLQFMAKALHPEAFRDVDPEFNLQRFYSRWLPVEPRGLFMLANGASA